MKPLIVVNVRGLFSWRFENIAILLKHIIYKNILFDVFGGKFIKMLSHKIINVSLTIVKTGI